MATIEQWQRKGKNKKSYRVRIRMRGHNVAATFRNKEEADTWKINTESEIRKGTYRDQRDSYLPLGDALKLYDELVSSKKAPSTRTREQESARQLLRLLRPETLLPDITPAMMAQYRDFRLNDSKVGASSVRLEFALASHLYTIAVREWGLVLENPVKLVKRPSAPPGRVRMLTAEESAKLITAAKASRNNRLYYYLLTMLHTGMRPGEAAKLKRDDIDLKKRRATLAITKNKTRRTVPLTEPLCAALGELLKLKKIEELKLTAEEKKQVDLEYLFLDGRIIISKGKPERFLRDAFEKARDRAKIQNLRMHDLRHTAASHLIMAGVDLRTLAEILGHKTLAMVLRYTHLLDSHTLNAIDRIAGLGIS